MLKSIDFFCVGSQKAGTTTLHDILKQHPDIYLPEEKEAHFFDVNEEYEKGIEYFQNTYFGDYDNQKSAGNINPNLEIETRSIDRIIKHFGRKTKFIYIIRNPVDRAYSHYLMSKKRGYEKLDFKKALMEEENRINSPRLIKDYESQEPGHFEKNHQGYIRRSKYSKTIKFLYDNVPTDNIKIIQFERFIENKKKIVDEILSFLEVDQYTFNLDLNSNKAEKARIQGISNFLNRPSPLKDAMKSVFSPSLRNKVKKTFLKANYKTLNSQDKQLTEDLKAELMPYFKADIIEVEHIINHSTGYLDYIK